MPHVRKRGSKWSAVLRDRTAKKPKWLTLPVSIKTKRQALKAAEKIQDDWDRARLGLPTSSPVSEGSWLAVAAKVLAETETTATESWAASCRRFTERFAEFVGDVPASHVSEETCHDYLTRRREQGASESYLRKEVTFLARVFRRAGVDHWRNVRKPTERLRPPHFLSHEQFEALVEAAPPDRAFLWALLTYTGARRGEALALTWADVDLGRRSVTIHNAQKGRGTRLPYRKVPVCDYLLRALKEREGAPSEALWRSPNNWRRDLIADCRRAGIEGQWTPHDLRHTFCSWLAQTGVSLHRIRDVAGHQSVVTTERYAHLLPAADEDVRRALNAKGSKALANVVEIGGSEG